MVKQQRQISKEPIGTHTDDYRTTNWVLRTEVYYDLGGANYFSGGSDRRGYWVSVSPLGEGVSPASGMSFTCSGMGSGLRHFLKEAKRFNQKELDGIVPPADIVEEMKKKVLAKFWTDNKNIIPPPALEATP